MLSQCDLFDSTIEQKFEEWKATRGGAQILRLAYIICARYARRHHATGRQVSMKLIWELLRDNVQRNRARLAARGIVWAHYEGFALNNIFTSRVARHIMTRRPDWAGLFELREVDVPRKRRKVLVVEESIPA